METTRLRYHHQMVRKRRSATFINSILVAKMCGRYDTKDTGIQSPNVYVIMGVSGSGKTLIGTLLSKRLGCPFFDADDYHSEANRKKMASGIPLSDEDRWPWLDLLRALIVAEREKNGRLVLACSALKQAYREILCGSDTDTYLVHLTGNSDLIAERLKSRTGHYMNPILHKSQLETLEAPTSALAIDIAQSPQDIIETILDSSKYQDSTC